MKYTNEIKEKLVAYIEKGLSSFKIAEEMNVSQPTMRYWLKKFNLKTVCLTGKRCLPSGIISENEEDNTHYKCSKCNKIQEINNENFYFRKNKKVHPWCRKCNDSHSLQRARDIKQKCAQYKGGKCIICNYNKCIGALEFHHVDPSIKDFGISRIKTFNWEKVKKELDKCVLLCSNCHKELHGGVIKLE